MDKELEIRAILSGFKDLSRRLQGIANLVDNHDAKTSLLDAAEAADEGGRHVRTALDDITYA